MPSSDRKSVVRSQAEDGIRDESVTGVQTCALPIDRKSTRLNSSHTLISYAVFRSEEDRKSTRLNSSHTLISYAVFCLKKNITQLVRRLVWRDGGERIEGGGAAGEPHPQPAAVGGFFLAVRPPGVLRPSPSRAALVP